MEAQPPAPALPFHPVRGAPGRNPAPEQPEADRDQDQRRKPVAGRLVEVPAASGDATAAASLGPVAALSAPPPVSPPVPAPPPPLLAAATVTVPDWPAVDGAEVAEGPRGREGLRAALAGAEDAGVEAAVVGGRGVRGGAVVLPGDRVAGVDRDRGRRVEVVADRDGRGRGRLRTPSRGSRWRPAVGGGAGLGDLGCASQLRLPPWPPGRLVRRVPAVRRAGAGGGNRRWSGAGSGARAARARVLGGRSGRRGDGQQRARVWPRRTRCAPSASPLTRGIVPEGQPSESLTPGGASEARAPARRRPASGACGSRS